MSDVSNIYNIWLIEAMPQIPPKKYNYSELPIARNGQQNHLNTINAELAQPTDNCQHTIIFPDQRNDLNCNTSSENATDCIAGFCAEVEDYPTLHILNILDKTILPRTSDGEIPVETRGGEEEEKSLCPSKIEYMHPRLGKSVNGTTRYIVNVETYEQKIRVERCMRTEPVEFVNSSFPKKNKYYCTEKHIVRVLLVLASDGKPIYDSFEYPSCCICVYKSETKYFEKSNSRMFP